MIDWIKHGCEEALIEVNIFHDEINTTAFQRQFNVTGMDEFKINEKKFNRKQFLSRVKEFNIQVENLCQFLPQDRVQDFAKMNHQELLANTQLSVCSEEVQNQFQALLELRQSQLDIDKGGKVRQKEVEDLQAKNEALRPQIENIQARTELAKELEVGNKKVAWLNYEKWDLKVVEYTKDLNQAQTKLIEAEKKLAPIKKQSLSIITEKQEMESKINTDRDLMQKLNQDINKQHDQLTRLSHEIRNAKGEIQDVIAQARDRKHEINQVNTMLAALTQDLANLKEQEKSQAELKAQIEQIQRRFREISLQKNQLITKRGQLQDENREIRNSIDSMKNRVVNMENEERRKLEALKNRDHHTYQATMWLKENRHMFKGHIYNPVILELRLKEQVNAKYLENTIQFRDFHTFGCEDADDVEVFLHEMRVKLKLSVNAYHADPATHLQFRPTYRIDEMRRHGFQMYMIDAIGGPAPVLNYLCKIYRIHEVPICDESVGMKISSLPKEIRLLFTRKYLFLL